MTSFLKSFSFVKLSTKLSRVIVQNTYTHIYIIYTYIYWKYQLLFLLLLLTCWDQVSWIALGSTWIGHIEWRNKNIITELFRWYFRASSPRVFYLDTVCVTFISEETLYRKWLCKQCTEKHSFVYKATHKLLWVSERKIDLYIHIYRIIAAQS